MPFKNPELPMISQVIKDISDFPCRLSLYTDLLSKAGQSFFVSVDSKECTNGIITKYYYANFICKV